MVGIGVSTFLSLDIFQLFKLTSVQLISGWMPGNTVKTLTGSYRLRNYDCGAGYYSHAIRRNVGLTCPCHILCSIQPVPGRGLSLAGCTLAWRSCQTFGQTNTTDDCLFASFPKTFYSSSTVC